ncbi:receptor-like protein EIX2 [Pistacia vera]|uniref:receptor-like protein EIX2 n=1 Tax=Pistacia vera TaxID=55513 RepID=UPI001263117E|nr:receptor-like protein EIX2 [Pistacia vera]
MSIVVLFLELLALATINICFCNRNTHLNCIESEREALLRFKHDLKDPSNRLTSWNGDGDCCSWAGVVCDKLTGRVLQLHLQNPWDPYNYTDIGSWYDVEYDSVHEAYEKSMLGGKINPSLLDLKDLVYLNLSNNDFEGIQIPRFLGSMGKLRYLDLSRAEFSGMIPHQLGNLSDLKYLDLSFSNHLYAENTFWLSGLSLLEHLGLSWVNLSTSSEWLQAINNLSVLKVLQLSGCRLYNFPPLPIANFSSLSVLHLSDNNLGDTIPSWMFGLSDLVFLSLSDNNFQGPIPDGLQNLTSLRHFDLYFNNFNSTFPNWLYKFSHLEYLDLSENKIEGRLPRSFGTLCNLKSIYLFGVKLNQSVSEVLDIFSGCISEGLQFLDLDGSQLFGHLTDKLGKLKNLVSLNLHNNSIRGSIPFSMGKLLSLEYLDLSYNKLDGTISEIHFANLTKLSSFSASQNSITLTFSPDWLPPFQLMYLSLDSCFLGPKFPSWLHSQKNLDKLEISNSRIVDTISNRFLNSFPHITYLNLSHNQIHGELPNLVNVATLESLFLNSNNLSGPLPLISSKLMNLDLSNNSFSGSISQFLCHGKNESKNMELLYLKDNVLSGELPNCWMNYGKLHYLNLGNNNFTSHLPTSMGNLTSLISLHLHKNNLSGIIPDSLKSINNLAILDLSENQFFAKIPTWIGESLSSMIILNLRSNKFHGVLPVELCRLSSLQILDLAENNLSGTIPRCVNNFSAMITMEDSFSTNIPEYMNGTDGQLLEEASLVMKGEIAEYRSILNLVRILDFSKNNFSGEIPLEVTNLKVLQSLNLSHNFLTGRIPRTIGAMISLESLDCSGNLLSGEIPSSTANLTFLSHLNLSNNNLTGRIPLSTQLQSFDASCFDGNELCGDPLPKNCTPMPNHEEREDDGDEHEVNWFYVSMPIGFVVGFWGVIGPVVVNRKWRYKYVIS